MIVPFINFEEVKVLFKQKKGLTHVNSLVSWYQFCLWF